MSGRVAFFSPRDFGLIGTPGTYRIIEEVAKYHEVRVFSLPPSSNSVHWWQDVPLVPLDGALSLKGLAPVLKSIEAFSPDVLYVFNAPRWTEAVECLKQLCLNSKVVFDIKSPLLVKDYAQAKEVQRRSESALGFLDFVITHAPASPKTWFGQDIPEAKLLPPGIDLSLFPPRLGGDGKEYGVRKNPLHLVYAATLHSRRKTSRLVQGFERFLSECSESAVLHIYGDGPEREDLERQVDDCKLGAWIRFHGQVLQKELFAAMARMDGAIGWVPKELYDQSPSLKVLEYMAAGLPVLATNTSAHREMEQEGFTLDFCEDTPESLAEGLSRWLEEGFGEERIRQNRRAIEARDYPRLVRERLLPVLDELLDEPDKIGVPQIKEATAGGIVPIGDAPSEGPLRILIVMSPRATGAAQSDKLAHIEQEAVDLAGAMAARSHRLYLAYQDQGALGFEVDERVVLFPYGDPEALEILVQGGRLDVIVTFSYDDQSLTPVARLANRYRLPLVVHDSVTEERQRSEGKSGGGVSRSRASWVEEVRLSLTTRRTGVMVGIGSQQASEEWETLLRQAATATGDGELYRVAQGEDVAVYERALHARRMRQKVLEG